MRVFLKKKKMQMEQGQTPDTLPVLSFSTLCSWKLELKTSSEYTEPAVMH